MGTFRRLTVGFLGVALCVSVGAGEENSAAALIDHATTAMRSNPEVSKQDAERALQLISKSPDADLEVRARLLLCDYYSERDAGAARSQIDAANLLLPAVRRKGLRAGVLTCRGETFESAGDYSHALADFDEAVMVATAADDQNMLAEALFSRAFLRALQGDYATGMSDAQRSQELFTHLDMPQHALTALSVIATIYNRMGDYGQAAQIYERARTQQHDAGLRRDEAVSFYNLGRARQKLGQWDAARASYSAGLALCRELNYTRGEAYAMFGLASVANGTEDPNAALSDLAQATELLGTTTDARLTAQIQLARGVALRKLQRGAEALVSLEQAESLFKQDNSLEELGLTYNELAAVHAQMSDWQSAFKYRSAAQETSETLLHKQLDQRFAALKVEFDTAAKDKENALLLNQNAANQKALAEERRASALQTTVILLSLLLLGVLSLLVLRQRRGARHMRSLAMTDELTGAPNRRAVLAHLAEMLQRGSESCSILVIDIDHFKSINDQHGHAVGDVTLQLLTAKLRGAAVGTAVLGRLGGEEFVVVLPNTTLQEAAQIADQIRAQVPSIDLSRWLGERRITVSIGVTTSVPEDTVSSMLRRADAALYAAKHAGRNCVRTDFVAEVTTPAAWRGVGNAR
jgi:diguanylate cyclase (GGDEF)-like protein